MCKMYSSDHVGDKLLPVHFQQMESRKKHDLLETGGMDVVDKIEAVGSQSGATSKTVIVKESGEILD